MSRPTGSLERETSNLISLQEPRRLIDSVIDTFSLFKRSNNLSPPEQLDIRVPLGHFVDLSNLGSFDFHLGALTPIRLFSCEGKLTFIRHLGGRSLV